MPKLSPLYQTELEIRKLTITEVLGLTNHTSTEDRIGPRLVSAAGPGPLANLPARHLRATRPCPPTAFPDRRSGGGLFQSDRPQLAPSTINLILLQSDWIEIMKFNPPVKKPRTCLGKRTINGALLDVRAAAAFLGVTEKTLRARVARHQVPFRVWGGRVVFVRAELDKFLDQLPGCSLDEIGSEKKSPTGNEGLA